MFDTSTNAIANIMTMMREQGMDVQANAIGALLFERDEIVGVLELCEKFAFDPATHFIHAVDGGEPKHSIVFEVKE